MSAHESKSTGDRPGKDRSELSGQTALRGLAALDVAIAHVAYFHLFPNSRLLEQFYRIFYWHNEAVDLFFELSGFILCYVYTARKFRWSDYGIARFARIYPVYFVVSLVLVALLYYEFKTGRGLSGFSFSTLAQNFLLIQNWPFFSSGALLNFPSWSVSVEVFLYIFLFPFLYWINPRLNDRLKGLFVFLPVAIQVAAILTTWRVSEDGSDVIWPPFDIWRGILCFTSGFFVCSLGMARSFPNIVSRRVEVFFLTLMLVFLTCGFPLARKISLLGFPLLAYLSAQEESLLTRALRGSWLAWLGHLSYSIYLWHFPVFRITTMAVTRLYKITHVGFFASPLLIVLISAPLILLVSHISHFYLERPSNKWLRTRLSRRTDPFPVSMR